jgi:surface antigen
MPSARGSALYRPAALLALAAAFVLAAPGALRAQGTYGTDQRYCDNSTLGRVLSTSKGNIVGSVAGAATGGLIGSNIGKGKGQTAATFLGVIGGALAGGYIGRSMDQTDQGCVGQSLEHAPANQPVAWQNPGSGSSYWVTPTQERAGPNGETCRNYVADAVINGQPTKREYTACRQADGSWIPVSRANLRPVRVRPVNASVSADTVLKVQQRLHDLGFYVRDNIDGQWGPSTSSAVRNFQQAKGLNPTGQLDLATLGALDLAPDAGAPPQDTAGQPPAAPRN